MNVSAISRIALSLQVYESVIGLDKVLRRVHPSTARLKNKHTSVMKTTSCGSTFSIINVVRCSGVVHAIYEGVMQFLLNIEHRPHR